MITKTHILLFVSSLLLLLGCKGGDGGAKKVMNGLSELDLLPHGLPISVQAPAGADVVFSDMGVMKDITVKGEGNYSLQISSGVATTYDVAKIKSELKTQVEQALYFDAILEEVDNGFIYRKKVTEERINHDFRFIKIQGDQEYIFQTGLMGQFSEDEVKAMFKAVQ